MLRELEHAKDGLISGEINFITPAKAHKGCYQRRRCRVPNEEK